MNASAFCDLWVRVLFLNSQKCTSRKRVQFKNFKTSRATINKETNEQVHASFCLLFFKQCSVDASMLAIFYGALRAGTLQFSC